MDTDSHSAAAPQELAGIGDRFLRDRRAAILTIPYTLAPTESNWLINPQHPDSSRIRLRPVEAFEYDPRFFKSWVGLPGSQPHNRLNHKQ